MNRDSQIFGELGLDSSQESLRVVHALPDVVDRTGDLRHHRLPIARFSRFNRLIYCDDCFLSLASLVCFGVNDRLSR